MIIECYLTKLMALTVGILFLIGNFFSCKQAEMEIVPIVDDYALQNGGTPVQDLFLINNFIDNKESIVRVFDYIQTEISPNLPYGINIIGDFSFLFDKTEVEFEDGYSIIDSDYYLSFVMGGADYKYFKSFHVYRNYEPYKFIINGEEIIMDYKTFNLKVLHQFYKICNEQYLKDKRLNYKLIRRSDSISECEIRYQDAVFEVFKIIII